MTGLAAYENRPIGPRAPIAFAGSPRSTMRWRVGSRAVPSACDDQQAGLRAAATPPGGPDRRLQAGHVVAERGAETPGSRSSLHVDDHQRSPVEIDGKRRRFGIEVRAA